MSLHTENLPALIDSRLLVTTAISLLQNAELAMMGQGHDGRFLFQARGQGLGQTVWHENRKHRVRHSPFRTPWGSPQAGVY